MREYHVYILASHKRGTLYVGVTNDIGRRLAEHCTTAVDCFTRRYQVHLLVHLETYPDPRTAITREKRLKKWPRAWKIALVEENNPEWRDLVGNTGG